MNTLAVVLRREDWNGDDCRLTIFTKDRGRIEAVARGLRKAKSKLAAHLEPLTVTEIFLVEGRGFPIVAGSSVVERHLALRCSLTRLSAAGIIMRLVDTMAPFEHRDDIVFEFIASALTSLEDKRAQVFQSQFLARAFAWKVLMVSGYHPELRRCLQCDHPVTGGAVRLLPRRGGVAHGACAAARDETAIPLSFPALKGLAYLTDAPLQNTLRLRAKTGTFSEMIAAIEALVEERFEIGAGSAFWQIL